MSSFGFTQKVRLRRLHSAAKSAHTLENMNAEQPAQAEEAAPADGAAAGELRIVFLDIDGVICCNQQGRLETDKLARLQRVCKLTQSRVCLSSDWRRHVSARNHVRKTLNALGIKMIGMTPIGAPWARPREITAWLTSFNQRQVAEGKAECRAWVAVDDRLLLEEPGGEKLHGHFVRTMPHRGLTDEKASMMCAMLLKSDGAGAATPGPVSPEAEEFAFGLGAGGTRAARPLSVHGTHAAGGPRRTQLALGTVAAPLTIGSTAPAGLRSSMPIPGSAARQRSPGSAGGSRAAYPLSAAPRSPPLRAGGRF